MKNVTDAAFDADVIGADKPVLVDFWAQWCGPCKAMQPALEALEASMGSEIDIAKVDIDSNRNSAQRFNVRSVPTFVIIKGGKAVATHVGAMPASKLNQWVKQAIA